MPSRLLTFVQISDTHISPDPEYGKKRSSLGTQASASVLVKAVNDLPFPVDFVLHTGDVAYDPDATAYQTAHEVLSQIRFPVYYIPGNHDHRLEMQRLLLGHAEPQPSFYYTFEINGVQVICLDSNGPAEPPRGNIIPEQLAWLDALCDADDQRPLVVAVHHNALPVGSPWLDDYMRITNGEALHQTLLKARSRLRGVFFGHVHQNIQMYKDDILYTSALSSWCQFNSWPGSTDTVEDMSAPGFNVVSLTADQTFIRRWQFHV